jgi:uncharacterized membrane protein YkvI
MSNLPSWALRILFLLAVSIILPLWDQENLLTVISGLLSFLGYFVALFGLPHSLRGWSFH